MELANRPHFGRTRGVWDRFWRGELKRPAIIAVRPRTGVEPVGAPPWGAAYDRSPEDVVDQALRWAETHEFLGDAVPWHTPSICVGQFGAFLGARIEESREPWGVDTRAVPFVDDLDSVELRLDRSSPWWERYLALIETYRRKCFGHLIFGEASVSCNLDYLAHIRSQTQVMMDFFDDPGSVHRVLRQLQAVYDEIIAEQRCLFEVDIWGSVTRHGLYSTGLTAVPQCDFGFNIGKEHFDEFVLPYLTHECDALDDVEYHLDGPGNLAHLESVCSIESIDVIQWVAGSGEAQRQDWSGLYDDITARGKGLWFGARIEDVIPSWERYGASGRLCLTVHDGSPDDVRRLMDKLEEMARA